MNLQLKGQSQTPALGQWEMTRGQFETEKFSSPASERGKEDHRIAFLPALVLFHLFSGVPRLGI